MRRLCLSRVLVGLALGLVLCGLGCTQVKFIQKNPYTGEIWTVYSHFAGSDSLTYCAPVEGVGCVDAQLVEGMLPPAAVDPTTAPPTGLPPSAQPPFATPQ